MKTPTKQAKAELLYNYFVNRDDTYALQWRKDSGDFEYWRVRDKRTREPVPLNLDAFYSHMDGRQTIGTYALSQRDTCKWICLDIDISKGTAETPEIRQTVWDLAKRLYDAIKAHADELPMLLEFSGNRGFHIWLFAEDLKGQDARALGLYFSQLVTPPDGLHIEVYPKQAAVDNVGSLVKIPLGKHQKTGNWCSLITTDGEIITDPYGHLATIEPWPADWWGTFMDLHDIEAQQPLRFTRKPAEVQGLPCINAMLEKGAQKGQRDEAAYVVATYLIRHGLPYDVALAAITEWNYRNEEPLPDEVLRNKLTSATNNNFSYFPCQKTLLDNFCDTSCRFYANKMATRNGQRKA